uniref:Cation-transporting ATPase n=1 Tax=Syphacia muris TaxID=451379 RepID=A0A0N5AJ36_9BILA
MKLEKVDQLVDSITTYRRKPVWIHGYVAPFVLIYAAWMYIWLTVYGIVEYWELGCIVIGIIAVSQEYSVEKATLVKVVPTPNNGWTEQLPLHHTKYADGRTKIWFEFQKVHYSFDKERKVFRSLELDSNKPMQYFHDYKGLETEEAIVEATEELGNNHMEMVVPQFIELFKERATAPFFVFQVFCVGLWCLEDMWYYSLFTLLMLMTFEATLVKQQLKNMSEIRNMGNKPYPVYAYRQKRWNRVSSDELLPGDLISVVFYKSSCFKGRSQDGRCVPCDLLLLRGQCIVDESMLTGESVPQMKESVENVGSTRYFDFDSDSRLHVVCGGTQIVQHTPPAKNEAGLKGPDGGCLFFVLKTGFNTNQGRLLRTIMFGVKRVTANNRETFAFIMFLLVFAIVAAAYLWTKGSEDESRSKYKLFLECSLILTSVIPPELPIELSLAVNNSLVALQKLGVFCTEPFRIPFAGKIDICCFDKTGTLTTDNLVVEGIVMKSSNSDNNICQLISNPNDTPAESIQVLVSCHSLVRFDEELVGDPLEKACLTWAEWNVTKNDTVIPKKSKLLPLKIFHRYHFTSSMKRMTVIAGYFLPGTSTTKHIVAVKGAPEVLEPMFSSIPDDYKQVYQHLTRQGSRVLALGIKEVGSLSYQEIRETKREDFETELNFAGFVVISCPLKKDTKSMIKEIVESSHNVVMITGDNPLTACHVAKVLHFTDKNLSTLVLDEPRTVDGQWMWESVYGDKHVELKPEDLSKFLREHEFCLTGASFNYLLEKHHKFLREILSYVKIFARMAPKQKERVINELKALGHITLMCGDGTNDVGALKHANVGVALLSHPYNPNKEELSKKKNKSDDSRETNLEPNEHGSQITPGVRTIGGVRKLGPHVGRRGDGTSNMRQPRHLVSATKKLEQVMKEMEEEEKAQVVRLGDASIAAPFTSKYSSIQSICHVIKQGRCTLVTTLQMFKILALNALILAYSQSVLYLDGIKFSDSQATIQGLLLAACFLFISRSRPLKVLAHQRPIPNIFNIYTLFTVAFQFIIHFGCLVYVVQQAHIVEPRDKIDLDADFKPSVLNSAVYIMSMALQGRPFMESLFENKPLLYSLLFSGAAVFTLASGVSPDLLLKFELIEFMPGFRNILVSCVVVDLVACFVIDRILNFIFGDYRG